MLLDIDLLLLLNLLMLLHIDLLVFLDLVMLLDINGVRFVGFIDVA
jgi:hypothetical protein